MTQKKEYTLEELIYPEDLAYIRQIYPSKIPLFISKWITQEKREEELAKNPPKPEQALLPEALEKTVREGLDKVTNSDVETQLATQIIVLQQIFQVYTQKMVNADSVDVQRIFGELALKAQSQCRKTLTALVQLKDRRKKNSKQTNGENTP